MKNTCKTPRLANIHATTLTSNIDANDSEFKGHKLLEREIASNEGFHFHSDTHKRGILNIQSSANMSLVSTACDKQICIGVSFEKLILTVCDFGAK